MDDFKRIKSFVEEGICSTESILHFYNEMNKVVNCFENINNHQTPILFLLDDLLIYFPNFQISVMDNYMRNRGFKKFHDDSKVFYKLSDILACFDFMFKSSGISK
jgi:hypothetical protein